MLRLHPTESVHPSTAGDEEDEPTRVPSRQHAFSPIVGGVPATPVPTTPVMAPPVSYFFRSEVTDLTSCTGQSHFGGSTHCHSPPRPERVICLRCAKKVGQGRLSSKGVPFGWACDKGSRLEHKCSYCARAHHPCDPVGVSSACAFCC